VRITFADAAAVVAARAFRRRQFQFLLHRCGWTVGAGLEALLGGNWTGKIEYLYIDLGNVQSSIVNTLTAPPNLVTFNSRITDNIVRIGLNYHFYSPVIAKY